jgi:phospholipid/cholesterol/gamma-HCH transport system substrate-binding protein
MSQAKSSVKIIRWVIAAILLAGGYFFLKDYKLSKNNYYYAYFTDVQGLQPSSQVHINGVRVGKIKDVELSGRWVKITLSVNKNIQLPVGTTAKLTSGGIASDKMVELDPGPGPAILAENATLDTKIDTSLLPVSVRFTPMFETLKYILKSTDTTLREASYLINSKMISKTAVDVIKLDEKSQGIAKVSASLNANTDKIVEGFDDVSAKTGKMVSNENNLNHSIDNINDKAASMAKANTRQKIDSIHKSISNLGVSFRELNASTKGLGKLLNNQHNYRQYSGSLDTMSSGMQDYRKNPPGFSIFGKKKKKK